MLYQLKTENDNVKMTTNDKFRRR